MWLRILQMGFVCKTWRLNTFVLQTSIWMRSEILHQHTHTHNTSPFLSLFTLKFISSVQLPRLCVYSCTCTCTWARTNIHMRTWSIQISEAREHLIFNSIQFNSFVCIEFCLQINRDQPIMIIIGCRGYHQICPINKLIDMEIGKRLFNMECVWHLFQHAFSKHSKVRTFCTSLCRQKKNSYLSVALITAIVWTYQWQEFWQVFFRFNCFFFFFFLFPILDSCSFLANLILFGDNFSSTLSIIIGWTGRDNFQKSIIIKGTWVGQRTNKHVHLKFIYLIRMHKLSNKLYSELVGNLCTS